MAEENNYAESPYVASKVAFLARQKQNQQSAPNNTQSIHASFQKHQSNSFKHTQQQQVSVHPIQGHHPFPVSHPNSTTFQQQLQQQMHTNNQLIQHPSSDSTSSVNTNQFDKENRTFSTNINGSSKSSAIFDRLDIMNSEKPHRFKVNLFHLIKK